MDGWSGVHRGRAYQSSDLHTHTLSPLQGLGKTVQLAAFLGGLRRSGRLCSGGALIVAPATLMSQWAAELHAWAPRCRVVVLHRSAAAFAAQPPHKV